MKRNVDIKEISDGRLYSENDMVKADCHGCNGCHQCCTGMGKSVILDPCDVHRLRMGTGKNFQQLLEEGVLELQVVDGCILPNLRMVGDEERCVLLNFDNRCSVHPYRPGVCRLFPLGRYYENGEFKYFLQVGECAEKNRSKVKVSKWLDTPSVQDYHVFICRWHYLLKDIESKVTGKEDSEVAKQLNMQMLNVFYMTGFEDSGFYSEFQNRVTAFRARFQINTENE